MRNVRVLWFVLPALLLAPCFASARQYLVYFGTYTAQQSEGIYAARFDDESGALESLGLAAPILNPSFLTIDVAGEHLYAVSELGDSRVSAFKIDRTTAKLTFINAVSAHGSLACHLAIDATGKTLAIANYGSGSVATYRIRDDGGLEEAKSFIEHTGSSVTPRQSSPHAHCVNYSANNRFVLAADLGTDEVKIYRLNASDGSLTPNDPPAAKVKPGSGPRHFAFHPGGSFGYVLNEIASTVTAFGWNASNGTLSETQTISTLPDGFDGRNSTAEIEAHPSGKFIYASNRGHNSIAVFASDAATGRLSVVERVSSGGSTPRSFGVHPSGRWFFSANQNSDNVVLFRIDPASGKLTRAGKELAIDAPVCVQFLALD